MCSSWASRVDSSADDKRGMLACSSLKRFKDDAKEVAKGYDCGIQVKNYNDVFVNDVIEAYQEVEVKKKLK